MNIFQQISTWISSNYMILLNNLFKSGLYFILGIVLVRVYESIIIRILKLETTNKRKATIAKVFLSIGKYFIWFIIGIFILDVFDVDTSAILGSAAVLGLAFSLGAQRLVSDFISGFFIVFEQTFHIGEVVRIDGFKGEVIDIGLRTTKIKDWTGVVKIITNGSINNVENFSRHKTIAVVDFGVAYETDLSKLKEIMQKFISSDPGKDMDIDGDVKYLGPVAFNNSDIQCRLIAECSPNKHYQVERDLRALIKIELENNDIEIPFPQIVVSQKKSG